MSIRPPDPPRLTDRFLAFADQQLNLLGRGRSFLHLGIYLSQASEEGHPPLVLVRQASGSERTLPSAETDPELRLPSRQRRWYPLQDGDLILGALRADLAPTQSWDAQIDQTLRDCAAAISHGLGRDLECLQLRQALDNQQNQVQTLIHQLRNPLSALRTYTQLLLRRMEDSSEHRPLVEGMLSEQNQLNRYINALDNIGQPVLEAQQQPVSPLMLPPGSTVGRAKLLDLLTPLIERARAMATLQGRPWHGPDIWPSWASHREGDGATAEIVANLLENAFRYSPAGCPIGLTLLPDGLVVWDGGPPIDPDERDSIFEKGTRGRRGEELPGTGLGLALARQLAQANGGDLQLHVQPSRLQAQLPAEGNAFRLSWPEPTAEG